MKHCMLDLETWGTTPGSAIRSIGAVTFDPAFPVSGVGEKFYRNISNQSCLDAELTQDPETVKWWSDPERTEASKVFSLAQYPLLPVAQDFDRFFKENECEFIWSQGAGFDIVLWECVCRKIQFEIPWNFRKALDTRTVYYIKNFDPRSVTFEGTLHHALHDAVHQARCILQAMR